jgi:uncharacterized membrane protein
MMLPLPFLALAIGVVAGLRSMTAPAAVAWAAHFGWLHLETSPLAFFASAGARYVLLALMLAELVADKLPFTPSRTRPAPFVGRILAGALAGAALAAGHAGSLGIGAVAGGFGALAGTLGGYRARTSLVRALKVPDYVVALAEDVVAVGGALLIVAAGS